VDITIVMGTWCSDSRREVPRFYKLFENLDFNIDDIKLINVDTKKEAEGTTVSELNIERVPTFIFKRGGEEIGRIIETPDESLEADMLKNCFRVISLDFYTFFLIKKVKHIA
jgi:thiol-disulfide isomerase/thioredoxin